MPYYAAIRRMTKTDRERTVKGLQRLRKQLDRTIPRKTRNATLVLGTWNIRNFDDNRFKHGPRTQEDLFYIAEVISRFDVLAVQEVCQDLGPLDQVMRILGGDYKYIVTDTTEGRSGNDERLCFIYDTSKVWFKGTAGELVLPDNLLIEDGERKRQFARTPFLCEFQASWFRFYFSTVHIYFGDTSGPKFERRVKEIFKVAEFLKKRAVKDEANHILVGDFNVTTPDGEEVNALKKNGFEVFENKKGSNKDQTKFYDQISFHTRKNELRLAPGDNSHGVVQYFSSIFRPADFDSYEPAVRATTKTRLEVAKEDLKKLQTRLAKATSAKTIERLKKDIASNKKGQADLRELLNDPDKMKDYYLREWRTFHASDHLPLWVELEIDFSEEYLKSLVS